MTTITIDKELLEQALEVIFANTVGAEDIEDAIREALAAPATTPDELDQLRKDAERYLWLKSAKGLTLESERCSAWTREDGTKFTPSHRLCAGGTQFGPHEHLDDAIDVAMKGTP